MDIGNIVVLMFAGSDNTRDVNVDTNRFELVARLEAPSLSECLSHKGSMIRRPCKRHV